MKLYRHFFYNHGIHVAYASTDKTNRLKLNRDRTLLLPGVDTPYVYVHPWMLFL